MRLLYQTLISASILITGTPLHATTLAWKIFTCPVGHTKFEATVYNSRFIHGQRPDGKPMETGIGYVAPPECPDNHLVLYRDFSPSELEKLTHIINTPDYRRLVKTESLFYRIAWLEHALNPASPDYVNYLLQATWYVDKDTDKKNRYRKMFLAAAEDIPYPADNIDALMLRLRVLNVYRETGQFDRALKGLEALPTEELSQGLPENVEEAYRLNEADLSRWMFVSAARQLRKLLLRQDASVNPIDIIPEWMAERECYFRHPKSTFEVAFCSTPEMTQKLKNEKDFFESERDFYEYEGPIYASPPLQE